MSARPSDFDNAVSQLLHAPFYAARWVPALAATARATGSGAAALEGLLSTGEIPVNIMPDKPDTLDRDWLECGGTDPSRNPMVRHGMRAPIFRDISDADVISRDERKRHPIWNALYDKYGFPHLCICPIWRGANAHLVVTLLRSAKQGPAAERDRRRFRDLALYWRSAALLARSLKSEGARLLAGALETLSISAIIVDGFGRIIAMTPQADETVRSGVLLRLDGERLVTAVFQETAKLDRALQCTLGNRPGHTGPSEFLLRGTDGHFACIRISLLPRENDIGFGAAALVVIERIVGEQSSGFQLCRLTAAETEIVAALLSGKPVASIARDRGVSIQTMRTQIKSIYSKKGVHSRAELMSQR